MNMTEYLMIQKNSILTTHYSPYDKEHMCFASYTSQTHLLTTMMVNLV